METCPWLCLNNVMDPNQQFQPQNPVTPPTPPAQPVYPTPVPGAQGPQNQYDFITSPQKPVKKGFNFGGGNFGVTIGIIVGGAAVLIIMLILIMNLLSGGGNSSKASLIGLAQTQNEIIRVSQKAEAAATLQGVKNLAFTVDTSVTSQQQQVLAILAKNGVKVKGDELKLKINGATDQKLATAKSTSTFDKTYSEIMQTSLESYAKTLKQINATTKSKTEKSITTSYIEQTELLISQIPYSQEEQ